MRFLLFKIEHDDWMFLVSCTGAEEGRAFKRPRILSTAGTPPKQYPDFDEDG